MLCFPENFPSPTGRVLPTPTGKETKGTGPVTLAPQAPIRLPATVKPMLRVASVVGPGLPRALRVVPPRLRRSCHDTEYYRHWHRLTQSKWQDSYGSCNPEYCWCSECHSVGIVGLSLRVGRDTHLCIPTHVVRHIHCLHEVRQALHNAFFGWSLRAQ